MHDSAESCTEVYRHYPGHSSAIPYAQTKRLDEVMVIGDYPIIGLYCEKVSLAVSHNLQF